MRAIIFALLVASMICGCTSIKRVYVWTYDAIVSHQGDIEDAQP